ncbi:MAG: class I SAM-dependent methyltransferase [Bacteroidetes bacterium]|nr:class I SAM-dependent methyltransferase [Bacteroidota bacterium]
MLAEKSYKLAVRWSWLTRWYDLLIRLTMREATFRSALLAQITVRSPRSILDIGCGTGTLLLLLERRFPKAELVGLDGDAHMLRLAEEKAKGGGGGIDFYQAVSYAMPFNDGSFDVATCSIMLHHLSDTDKVCTLKEAFRVLRSGGEIHIADWGKPSNRLMRLLFYIIQWLDGFDTTTANVQGKIPEFMAQAGFSKVAETGRVDTMLGTVALYKGTKL